jgi:DNA-binding Xre family transcriptional regulator
MNGQRKRINGLVNQIINEINIKRIKKKMTLEDIHKRTEIGYNTVHGFLRGHRKRVSFLTLLMICEAVDISLGDFLNERYESKRF